MVIGSALHTFAGSGGEHEAERGVQKMKQDCACWTERFPEGMSLGLSLFQGHVKRPIVEDRPCS